MALDAYPEAYEELKHCLLTLVFSQENADNPVSPQWDLNTRHTLAAQLGRAVRQAKGTYPVSLELLLEHISGQTLFFLICTDSESQLNLI